MEAETRLFGRVLKESWADRGVKTLKDIGRQYGMMDSAAIRIVRDDSNPTISRAVEYLKPLGLRLAIVPDRQDLPEGSAYVAISKHKNKSAGNVDERYEVRWEKITKN